MKNVSRYLPYIIYSLVSFIIILPFLSSGYLFSLDMAFGPDTDYCTLLWGLEDGFTSAPMYLLLQILGKILPSQAIGKIILFIVLFLAGIGASKLFPSNKVGSYFAGLLYMLNPFTYSRFITGQWGVLLGYALLPFAITAFINLLESGNRKSIITTVLLTTFAGIAMVNSFALLLICFTILLSAKLIKERGNTVIIRNIVKSVLISIGLICVLNLYWIVPVWGGLIESLNHLSHYNLNVFTPVTQRIAFDITAMYGFWRPGYILTKDLLPFWWLIFMFILFLVISGFLNKFGDARYRWIIISFGIIAILGLLLAMGISSTLTRPAFEWLWENVFLFKGFRDSHKFVALLCLSYTYLGGLGVDEYIKQLCAVNKKWKKVLLPVLIVVIVILPIIYSFSFFGFHGQLKTTDYPEEWYEVNEYLNRDNNDFNVLFLPWHMYMDYSWLPNKNQRMATPAEHFFTKNVISGDNLEIQGIYSQSLNPLSKYVEFLLANSEKIDNLGELLALINVKYVILVHEVDFVNYNFLFQQTDLTVEMEKSGITLFRNEHDTARIYGVNSKVYINSLEEYLELSKNQDVMEHLYIIGNGANDSTAEASQMEKIGYIQEIPVKYHVDGTSQVYTIFTTPQNENTNYWEYNNNESTVKNLNIFPAFDSSPTGGEIVYTRFYTTYLPGYIISLITFILIVIFYFDIKSFMQFLHNAKNVIKKIKND